MATDVERLRYYERQFLGATDFTDEQDYHRDSLRRHLLGPHTWGIVTGLGLSTAPRLVGHGGRHHDRVRTGGRRLRPHDRRCSTRWRCPRTSSTRCRTSRRPSGSTSGCATPRPRRTRRPRDFSPAPPEATTDGSSRPTRSSSTRRDRPAYANDDVTVAGQPLDPATAVADYSIPYQELPDDATGLWTVPLGRVQYQASADPTVAGTFLAADGGNRVYGGVVAASLLAPAGGPRRRRTEAISPRRPGAAAAVWWTGH